jgi:hypothetical protein
MEISQQLLKTFLHYCPESGVFTRIKSDGPRQAARVGKPCGCFNRATGYVDIHVGGRKHNAHRLAWIYEHGPIPAGFRVDHENRVRSDNRLSNLRLATQADNLRNCKVRADNTSGVKGVTFDRTRNKWAAAVGRMKLGRFDTLFDAAAARRSAANRVFGAFANE